MTAPLRGICTVCGTSTDVSYWKLCRRCYRDQAARERAANDELRRELVDHMPLLIQLVHPDRHGNSPASTRATQWLLSLRRRLPALEHAAS